jgi:hypothetical protein
MTYPDTSSAIHIPPLGNFDLDIIQELQSLYKRWALSILLAETRLHSEGVRQRHARVQQWKLWVDLILVVVVHVCCELTFSACMLQSVSSYEHTASVMQASWQYLSVWKQSHGAQSIEEDAGST